MVKWLLDKKNSFLFWGFIAASISILIRNSSLPIISNSLFFLIKPNDGDPILLSLSTSYLVSVIFYFIVVYIPENKKKKSVMLVADGNLKLIATQMYVMINYILLELNLQKDFEKYEENDFVKLKERQLKFKDINFNYQHYFNGKYGSNDSFSGWNEILYLHYCCNSITKSIEEIFKLPNIINSEYKLIEILELIKNNWFISCIISKKIMPSKNNVDLEKGFYSFYNLFLKLEKYINIHDIRFEQDISKIPKKQEATYEDMINAEKKK